MSVSLLAHGWQNSFDDVDGREEIGRELITNQSLGAIRLGKLFHCAKERYGLVRESLETCRIASHRLPSLLQ